MNILAVDFGLKRIGIALFQGGAIYELPPIIFTNKFEMRGELLRLASSYNVEQVIIGFPEKGVIRTMAERLKNSLIQQGISVELHTESLTTRQAHHELSVQEATGSERKKRVDSVSAALLLKDYLEKKQL